MHFNCKASDQNNKKWKSKDHNRNYWNRSLHGESSIPSLVSALTTSDTLRASEWHVLHSRWPPTQPACVTFVSISPCSDGSIDPGDKNACGGVMKEKGEGTSWMLDWGLNVFQQPIIHIRDTRWVDGGAPPVLGVGGWRLLPLNAGSCRRETRLITGWLQTPRLLLCQDGGHLGVRSDILSNCIILLSMLTGYVKFYRSVPIIRAQLSRKDPPDVCDPFAIGLGAAPTKPPTSKPHADSV